MTDTVTVATAWKIAESFVYEQLLTHFNAKDGREAFQGYMPEPPERDLWALFSGGLGVGEIARFAGPNACWSTIPLRSRIVAVKANRLEVLDFMGSVMMFLSENDNLRDKSNVQEFRLAGMPEEPAPVDVGDERIMWRCELQTTLVFSTGTAFS